MQPNSIVHIVLGKANPERSNGVNKVVFELAMSQQANGDNVEIWGITKVPTVNFPERPFSTRLFQDSKFKFPISKALQKAIQHADRQTIFHLHGGFLPQMYSVAKHIVRAGKQYIYTPHGAYNTQAMKRSALKKRIFIRLFETYVVVHAKYVHVIGKSEIEGTQAVFGATVPVRLVPNGHRSNFSENQVKQPNAQCIHFGFLGRIDIVTKGLDILLEGFAQFIQSGNNGKLHIAGEGKDFEQLQARITALKIEACVVLHGAIFGEKKTTFFQQLDYFCLTSRNEGLPGVVLEALDYGVPCIVSKETNTGETIQKYEAGYVLSENTAQKLNICMQELMRASEQRLYPQRAMNAQTMVRAEYDWNVISKELINAYHAV